MCSCMVWFHYGKLFHCMSSSSLVLLSRCSVSISSGRVFFSRYTILTRSGFLKWASFQCWMSRLVFCMFTVCLLLLWDPQLATVGQRQCSYASWCMTSKHNSYTSTPTACYMKLERAPNPNEFKKNKQKNFICKAGSQEYDCFIKFTHYSDETQTFV